MCGILAVYNKNLTKEQIIASNNLQNHRGPDSDGYFEKDGLFLLHKRLSILDIKHGQQPMRKEHLTIIFNGEIYNHQELRKKLEKKGHHFYSEQSDTEVLLSAYLEWGEEMSIHLNGMWAFVIYDKKEEKLFISRDRFGEKPLYYYAYNNEYIVSSELKSITSLLESTELDIRALQKYFAYNFIPAPLTQFKNIFKLEAGCNMVYNLKSHSSNIRKYWNYELNINYNLKEDDIVEELRYLLEKSVDQRLHADVPVGIFLSGGLDSSLVSAISKQYMNDKMSTFNIGFNESQFDESYYAKEVSKYLNTDHSTKNCLKKDFKSDMMEIFNFLDEPLGDDSTLPTYLVSKLASQQYKVVLGGDGADELFYGYDTFKAIKIASYYKKIMPKAINNGILSILSRRASTEYMSFDFKLKKFLTGLKYGSNTINPLWLASLNIDEIGYLFNNTKIDIEDVFSESIELWDNLEGYNDLDKTSVFYVNLYMQNSILSKVDKTSMINSLEVRSPFLDYNLVDFISTVPADYKLKGLTTKYILKKAAEKYLPSDIINRKKHGFAPPISKWTDDEYFTKKKVEYSFLSQEFIEKKYRDHFSGKSNNKEFLWNYFVLQNTIA